MHCQNCTHVCRCDNYGCAGFLGDCVMLVATGGFWFIWIFVREMRKRR